MRVCVVGAGFSGLAAAFHLSKHPGTRVEVFEKSQFLGGRANVTEGGEHCPRIFLDDYKYLFGILREIPDGEGFLHDRLRPLTRYCHTESFGWVETSHLYMVLAKEIPLRERFRTFMAQRRSPLIADHPPTANANRYGSRKNLSASTVMRLTSNLMRSKAAFALAGPTDRELIEPWVAHLERRGVIFHRETQIAAIEADDDRVAVISTAGSGEFDLALVTAFEADVASLLDASGIPHSVRSLEHTHCKCLTVGLDPAEPLLSRLDQPAVFCHGGINILVQPDSARCVVICTRSPSTDDAYVLSRLRALLDLEHELREVRVRENQRPDEAVYCADYAKPAEVLAERNGRIYFAGSWLKNSYPLDSAEGAVRSAYKAVRKIRIDHDLAAPAPDSVAVGG